MIKNQQYKYMFKKQHLFYGIDKSFIVQNNKEQELNCKRSNGRKGLIALSFNNLQRYHEKVK